MIGLEAFVRLEQSSKRYKGRKEDLDTIFQSLKALEIIKDKNVDVYWLKTSPNTSRYNQGVGSNQALKKKEYDLLKEILL